MAKVFISYKHRDAGVLALPGIMRTTARQYVDQLVAHIEGHDHIYKGEDDDEDISYLSEDRIAELLHDKIYDSTITVVLISKNMVEARSEKLQWIPREISYSLSENNRGGRVSGTNAVLAVILPDEYGSYVHFLQENPCCTRWPMSATFGILRGNMFNLNNTNISVCTHGQIHTATEPSYIPTVKWSDFLENINYYLQRAEGIRENIDAYDVKKRIPE